MSKYKTRRQQKRERTIRNIRLVFFIGGLLIILAVLAYYYFHRTPPQPAIIPPTTVAPADTVKTPTQEPQPTPKTVDTIVNVSEADSPQTIVAQPVKEHKVAPDTTLLKSPAVPDMIELTAEKMEQIVDEVGAKKTSLHSTANCVTIRKTSGSNVENVFEIATVLRLRGFVISGRQTVKDDVDGVEIDAGGNCITLTIGKL